MSVGADHPLEALALLAVRNSVPAVKTPAVIAKTRAIMNIRGALAMVFKRSRRVPHDRTVITPLLSDLNHCVETAGQGAPGRKHRWAESNPT
jgi:hypothetical protein